MCIGRSILNQQDQKLASGWVCGVLVELLFGPFWFAPVVVEILFFVGRASRWSVATVVATVVGDEGNERLWKKDRMVGVEGVADLFYFPFFGTE